MLFPIIEILYKDRIMQIEKQTFVNQLRKPCLSSIPDTALCNFLQCLPHILRPMPHVKGVDEMQIIGDIASHLVLNVMCHLHNIETYKSCGCTYVLTKRNNLITTSNSLRYGNLCALKLAGLCNTMICSRHCGDGHYFVGAKKREDEDWVYISCTCTYLPDKQGTVVW